MPNDKTLKKKYKRSIIKLGNSKAITFPQEWTIRAKLDEKAEVTLYPLDDKTLIVRAHDEIGEQKTIFNIDANIWPFQLMKQAILSAFKLNIDEIYISNAEKNQEELYELLVDLRKEIIGLDFKSKDDNEFTINFLLDSRKTDVPEVLSDLANTFKVIIKKIIEGTLKKNNEILLAEIDRKYSLGTRIIITGLSEYPISKVRNLPIIRFLGDRVVLLYIKEFITESFCLKFISKDLISKYADVLSKIPTLLIEVITNYNNINLETILEFHEYLNNLNSMLESIKFDEKSTEEQQIRNLLTYYLNSFKNLFDIGITRLIEAEIGMT